MNTKTMRLPPRRVLTPDKRRERDSPAVIARKPPGTAAPSKQPANLFPTQSGSQKAAASPDEPVASNQLLAGYLAHEFLTKGTLFGEPWDPAQAQSVLVSAPSAEPRKSKPSEIAANFKRRRYVEVAHLLRADGTRLTGIVNPAQLAGFLNL